MTAPLRAKKSNNIVVWAVLGLLIISLTGFGVQSIGSSSGQAVGAVGKKEITVAEYVRSLNAQIRYFSTQLGQPLSTEQALALGVQRQVVTELLQNAALDGENDRIGLSVGDDFVKDQLLQTQAFLDVTGKFDEAAYAEALRQANLKPAEYDDVIREGTARSLLQTGVQAGLQANQTYAMTVMSYVSEARRFRWTDLTADMLLDPIRAPEPAEIEAEYKANPETYTSQLVKTLTYALLTPDMLIDMIDVEDAALRALYESKSAEYNQPERRIVDRLVFPTEDAAQSALDAINAGEKTYDDHAAERGLTLDDLDMGEVANSDLSSAAADAVFALQEPGLAGPVQSSLGPALFRLNAVLSAQSIPFEDVADDLKAELVADRARRQISDDSIEIDDLLAGGATLEELAAETPMVVEQIAYRTGDEDGIAAYDEFRAAADRVAEDDYPEVVTLEDGGIFALRLDSVAEPALIPLADIRDQVVADWTAKETRRRLLEYAAELEEKLNNGKDFGDLGLISRIEEPLTRDAFVDGAPSTMVTTGFKLEPGQTGIAEDASSVALIRTEEVAAFNAATDENKQVLQSITAQFSQTLGADLFAAYVAALEEDAGITLNNSLINSIHSQLN